MAFRVKTVNLCKELRMKIEAKDFSGEGMSRVYENEKWTVGIKNWKPANDISNIDGLELHNETDELFILLSGTCVLVYANESGDSLDIQTMKMEPFRVYTIPATVWHNTITQKDTKLLLIMDVATGMNNSKVMTLSPEQTAQVKKLAHESFRFF